MRIMLWAVIFSNGVYLGRPTDTSSRTLIPWPSPTQLPTIEYITAVTGDMLRQIHLQETKKALFASPVTEARKSILLQRHVVIFRNQGDRGS
jgi:hypothetical protein